MLLTMRSREYFRLSVTHSFTNGLIFTTFLFLTLSLISNSSFAKNKVYTYDELKEDATVNQRYLDGLINKTQKAKEAFFNLPETRKVGPNVYHSYIPTHCKYLEEYEGIISPEDHAATLKIMKPYFIASDREYSGRRVTSLKRKRLSDIENLQRRRGKLIQKLANSKMRKKQALRVAGEIKTIDAEKQFYQNSPYYLPGDLIAEHAKFRKSLQNLINQAAKNISNIENLSEETFFRLAKIESNIQPPTWNNACDYWTPPEGVTGRELGDKLSNSISADRVSYENLDKALLDKMTQILSEPNSPLEKKLLQIDPTETSAFSAIANHIYLDRGSQAEKALIESGIIAKIEATVAINQKNVDRLKEAERALAANLRKRVEIRNTQAKLDMVHAGLIGIDGWSLAKSNNGMLLNNQELHNNLLVQTKASCQNKEGERDSILITFQIIDNSEDETVLREVKWLPVSSDSQIVPTTMYSDNQKLATVSARINTRSRTNYVNVMNVIFEYPEAFEKLANYQRTGKSSTEIFAAKPDLYFSTQYSYGGALVEWTSADLMPALNIMENLCVEYHPGDELLELTK